MDNKILLEEIEELCKAKDAVILAHYYVDGEIQNIADYVGDSFYLAKAAKTDPHKTIVFCGVTFMGESACILNPDKTVLIPDEESLCPMALMADPDEIRKMREEYEDLAVVTYINSYADTKELSDVCVTSSNAVRIVRNLPNENIYFIPDGNLGSYIAGQVPEKNVVPGNGYCHVHHQISPEDVLAEKEKHPNASVLAHPECRKEVLELADYIGSTSGIIERAVKGEEDEFIICTESGVLHELNKQSPDKNYYFIEKAICPNMKKLTLRKVRDCLKNGTPVCRVDEKQRVKAEKSLDRMLELAEA